MSSLWEFLASPQAFVINALPMLADAALKGAIVIATAALIVLALRRRSAATRHAVWAGAVVAQLALPVLAALLPAWRVPLLPAMSRYLGEESPWYATVNVAGAVRAEPVITISVPAPAVAITRPAAAPRMARATRVGGHATAGAVGFGGGVGRPVTAARFEPVVNWGAVPHGPSTWLRVAALVWLMGCLAVLARFIAGTLAVWRLSRRSDRVADGPWLSMVQRIANTLGVKRPLTLLRSGRFGIPVTWGVVYPVVLLPADADDWHEQRRQYVLVHEMAHVKRVDAFTQLIAQIAVAVFWFNPLVWLAVHRMRVEREHACDDYVLRQGTSASTYASDLLEMVRVRWREERTARTAFAALAMARPSELEGRMLAILSPDQDRRALPNRPAFAASMAGLALLVPLAAFNPFQTRESRDWASVAWPADVAAVTSAVASARASADLKHDLALAVSAIDARAALATQAAELAKAQRELQSVASAVATTRAFAVTTTQEEDCRSARLRRRGSSSHTSIHSDDDGNGANFQYMHTSAERCLAVAIAGKIEFSPDEHEVRSMSRDGRFYIHERLSDVERELTITRGSGDELEYEYVVNGRVADFGEGGQEWLAERIPEILRESGLNVRQRVSRLRKENGVRGILAEIEKTESSGAKRAAYGALLEAGDLTQDDLELVLSHASHQLTDSDGDMRAVLEQIGRGLKGRASTRVSQSIGEATSKMSSDGDKRAVLQQYGSIGDRQMLLTVMTRAGEISSDGDKSELLRALAPRYFDAEDDALREAYFAVSNTISSDGDRRNALMAALDRPRVSPAIALGVIESAKQISSDGDKAEVLVAIARKRLLGTPVVREAFMRATRSISSDGDYRRVMEVALQQ